MKVVCVDDRTTEPGKQRLTNDRIYYVMSEDDNLGLYLILDDSSVVNKYSKMRFKPISDIREEKLNKLGI